MHRESDAALCRAARVVAVPSHALWNIGVDTSSEEKGAGILDVMVVRRVQHGEADDSDYVEADHHDAAALDSVGHVSSGEGEETGYYVWRDCHQLSSVVLVAQVLDDGWEEEGEGVDWGEVAKSSWLDDNLYDQTMRRLTPGSSGNEHKPSSP